MKTPIYVMLINLSPGLSPGMEPTLDDAFYTPEECDEAVRERSNVLMDIAINGGVDPANLRLELSPGNFRASLYRNNNELLAYIQALPASLHPPKPLKRPAPSFHSP